MDVFSVRDGINDDLNRLATSITHNQPISLRTVGLTLTASVSAAFLGVHAIRALGFRSDFGLATGAVLGNLLLDVVAKSVKK